MTKTVPRGVAVLLAATLLCIGARASAEQKFNSDADEMLYFWGTRFADQLKAGGISDPEHLESVLRGLSDRFAGKAPSFGAEYPSLLNNWLVTRRKVSVEKEREASATFMKKRAREKGAVTTDSGLVYIELIPGTGKKPLKSSRIRAHYTGTLRDGTVFDSSNDTGEPLTIRLTQVIRCWREGIQMMRVGGKARLHCPADIAYGDRGSDTIPGGAALTFEIELLDIVEEG